MFTGIVEEVGVVRAATWRDGALQLAIDARRVLDGLAPGDSIAIDGVCQTVIARVEGEVTCKRFYPRGDRVRLEPANDAFRPLEFRADEVEIVGVVTHVIKKVW